MEGPSKAPPNVHITTTVEIGVAYIYRTVTARGKGAASEGSCSTPPHLDVYPTVDIHLPTTEPSPRCSPETSERPPIPTQPTATAETTPL